MKRKRLSSGTSVEDGGPAILAQILVVYPRLTPHSNHLGKSLIGKISQGMVLLTGVACSGLSVTCTAVTFTLGA